MPPDSPLRRTRNPHRTQVLVLLAGLAVVWLATGMLFWRGGPQPQVQQRFLYQLERLKASNPENDAAAALQRGDHRLLVLERGDGQKVPGVAAPEARVRFGVRVIPYLFDATTGKDLEQLQHAAFDYAFRYNVVIVKKSATSLPSTTAASASLEAGTTTTRAAPAATVPSSRP